MIKWYFLYSALNLGDKLRRIFFAIFLKNLYICICCCESYKWYGIIIIYISLKVKEFIYPHEYGLVEKGYIIYLFFSYTHLARKFSNIYHLMKFICFIFQWNKWTSLNEPWIFRPSYCINFTWKIIKVTSIPPLLRKYIIAYF